MKSITRLIFATFTILATFLPAAGTARAQSTTTCADLQNATPQKTLAYLQQDRSTLNPQCIDTALRKLIPYRYMPAIPTLIQYLDFKTLSLARNGQPLGGAYPAATALGQIGELAIPDVKAAVKNESLNRSQRRNAAALYAEGLSQDTPGIIKFLMQASKESKDAQVAFDLIDMATTIANYCPPNIQKQCSDALHGN